MSFASCSTRFESSPARTSDVGLHVDSARTTTSSPEFDAQHRFARGVVPSPRDRLRRRHRACAACPAPAPASRCAARRRPSRTAAASALGLAPKLKTGCGNPVPAPRSMTMPRSSMLDHSSPPPSSVGLRAVQLVSQRSHADSEQLRRLRAIAVRDLERALDQLRFGFVTFNDVENDRAVRHRRCVAVPSPPPARKSSKMRAGVGPLHAPLNPNRWPSNACSGIDRLVAENHRPLDRVL